MTLFELSYSQLEIERRIYVYPLSSSFFTVSKIDKMFVSLDVQTSKMMKDRSRKTSEILFSTIYVHFSKFLITLLIHMDLSFIFLFTIVLAQIMNDCSPRMISSSHPCSLRAFGSHRNWGSAAGWMVGDVPLDVRFIDKIAVLKWSGCARSTWLSRFL